MPVEHGLLAGIARQSISPFWGVELAGWGYYLQRRWTEVRDDLHATACCFQSTANLDGAVAVVALDLMTIGDAFVGEVRSLASAWTGIPAENILLSASHSHNAPTTGALLGVGDEDPLYNQWVARQTATAIVLAWRQRQVASVASASVKCPGITFNRTREHGPVDDTLTVLRVDSVGSRETLGIIANYQGHPTVLTELMPTTVTRDVPGEVCDRLESAFPGAIAMYLQGACGDVNFNRDFVSAERCSEPGQILGAEAVNAARMAQPQATGNPGQEVASALEPAPAPVVCARSTTVQLPVRHWTDEEIAADRDEAARRLADRDMTDWRQSIGRVMVNRPDDMVKRHGGDEWKAVEAMCRFQVEWTDRIRDQRQRDNVLPTEVLGIRIGDLVILSNATEFFTTLALDVRMRQPAPNVMIAAYSNGRIGYLPDSHDVERRTYAAYQSPKYCSQLPFIEDSGEVMCDAMVLVAEQLWG